MEHIPRKTKKNKYIIFIKILKKWISDYLISTLIFVVFLIIWEISAISLHIPQYLLPPPSSILREMWKWRTDMPRHIIITMYETLMGFILSVIIGIPLSIFLVISRFIRQVVYPFIIALQSTPKIVIAPLLVIWLGFDVLPKIVLAITMCVFPVVINTVTGFNSAPTDLIDLMRSLKASNWQILIRIRLPFALPYIFSSLKVAIVLSMMGALIGEIVGSDAGLGYVMIISMQYMNTARAFGAVILVSLISIIMFLIINLIEIFIIPWNKEETEMIV